jgi:hypothetical protein
LTRKRQRKTDNHGILKLLICQTLRFYLSKLIFLWKTAVNQLLLIAKYIILVHQPEIHHHHQNKIQPKIMVNTLFVFLLLLCKTSFLINLIFFINQPNDLAVGWFNYWKMKIPNFKRNLFLFRQVFIFLWMIITVSRLKWRKTSFVFASEPVCVCVFFITTNTQ